LVGEHVAFRRAGRSWRDVCTLNSAAGVVLDASAAIQSPHGGFQSASWALWLISKACLALRAGTAVDRLKAGASDPSFACEGQSETAAASVLRRSHVQLRKIAQLKLGSADALDARAGAAVALLLTNKQRAPAFCSWIDATPEDDLEMLTRITRKGPPSSGRADGLRKHKRYFLKRPIPRVARERYPAALFLPDYR
jgi:hypothetical protein